MIDEKSIRKVVAEHQNTEVVNWQWVSNNVCLETQTQFIDDTAPVLDWHIISTRADVTCEFLERFEQHIKWTEIAAKQFVDFYPLIRKYSHRVQWEYLATYDRMHEEFLIEFADLHDWGTILHTHSGQLSDDLIVEMQLKGYIK